MVKRSRGMLLQSIVLQRNHEQSLSTQLYQQLKSLMLDGSLSAGTRLPSSRTMAQELGVARATVVDIFERLVAEGLLESKVGAGTCVSQALNARMVPSLPAAPVQPIASSKLAKAMARLPAQFAERLVHKAQPFTTGIPALDAFPMPQWGRLFSKHWRDPRHHIMSYPAAHGYPPLRDAVAAHLRVSRGIVCDAEQIFIVGGAQYAFQLIAEMLIDAGDKVWFENPGHIGTRNCLILAGAELVPVPIDEAGLQVARGLQLAPQFKLAFVTPSHQQPLGVKMSLERRFALLKAAAQSDAWVIEDDWVGEFCVTDKPLPCLKEMDVGERVIYVGSFSKSLFPALRLGFILSPRPLVPFFQTNLEAFSPGVPTSLQAVVADFISEGHFSTHIRRMRKLYTERYEALQQAALQHLSPWLRISQDRTGLHTVAYLRSDLPISAETLCEAAAAQGLTLTPISRFCLEPIAKQGLVLGFAAYTPRQITQAVLTLKALLQRLTG